MRLALACTAGAIALAGASPTFAHEADGHMRPPMPHASSLPPMPDMRPDWKDGPVHAQGHDARARESWLAECRRNNSRQDRGLGGAAIGGVLGGILGNRIAGRGDRTVGTIAGAAAGAVAGAAIDRAEDRGRPRDWCESYLDDYYARYSQPQGHGYPGHGQAYGYAYAVPMMMVPAYQHARPQQECREEVTYEYVDVPVRQRRIHRAPARVVPDKRIRVAPSKRVPL